MTSLPPTLLVDPLSIAPPGASLADVARALAESQRKHWPLMRQGYEALANVRVKTLETGAGNFHIQWNPGRILSTAAAVDAASLSSRPCFLCPANLPAEQRGVDAGDGFLLLCNPYPIFREHFTIAHSEHIAQLIGGRFSTFLRLARAMSPRYSVLYNGPRCGASAPDHLHFQAGERGFMPIERELAGRWKSGVVIKTDGPAELRRIDDGLRWYLALISPDDARAVRILDETCRGLAARESSGDEPMLNILAWEGEGDVKVVLFPRKAHRPKRYYAEGMEKLVVSPAAVDCGGTVITPLERDFHRMDEKLLREIFGEVLGGIP